MVTLMTYVMGLVVGLEAMAFVNTRHRFVWAASLIIVFMATRIAVSWLDKLTATTHQMLKVRELRMPCANNIANNVHGTTMDVIRGTTDTATWVWLSPTQGAVLWVPQAPRALEYEMLLRMLTILVQTWSTALITLTTSTVLKPIIIPSGGGGPAYVFVVCVLVAILVAAVRADVYTPKDN
jgi:hypothetical protein